MVQRFDNGLLPGGRDISIYMLVSDFLLAQFYCRLCVGYPRRVETASAWTAPLRKGATLLCIGVPHKHRHYALMASSHVLILTRTVPHQSSATLCNANIPPQCD